MKIKIETKMKRKINEKFMGFGSCLYGIVHKVLCSEIGIWSTGTITTTAEAEARATTV